MQTLIENLFAATNQFDVEGALALFASEARLADTSVGEVYSGREAIRLYLVDYFVGYQTVTKILSIELADTLHAQVRVDFTGNFGHEIGLFDFVANSAGKIVSIDTRLE